MAFKLAGHTLSSRLIIGTGKFSSVELMKETICASGTAMVTVAVRRVDLKAGSDPMIDSIRDVPDIHIVPNTSGARTADEAIRLAHLAQQAGLSRWVKLEIMPNPRHLMPDPIETYVAAKVLVKDGFHVLPYIHADPVLARRLEDVGCAAVMPLGAPIGTNQGVKTALFIRHIIEGVRIPVIVDAGLGAPSHVAYAMELGADAVLVNTAIATAPDPVRYVVALGLAVQAGRAGFNAGFPGESLHATPSSPVMDFLQKEIGA